MMIIWDTRLNYIVRPTIFYRTIYSYTALHESKSVRHQYKNTKNAVFLIKVKKAWSMFHGLGVSYTKEHVDAAWRHL